MVNWWSGLHTLDRHPLLNNGINLDLTAVRRFSVGHTLI